MKTLFAAALFVAATATVPVFAQNVSKAVSYADLDLGSPDGQARLNSRLRRAVQTVCAVTNPSDLGERRAVRRCRLAASERAGRDAEVAVANYGIRSSDRLASGR